MDMSKDANYTKGSIAGYKDGVKDAVAGKFTDWSALELADLPVHAMAISTRAKNCLIYSGNTSVGDVLTLKSEDIMKMRNLGRKTASEIAKWLISNGFAYSAWSEYV